MSYKRYGPQTRSGRGWLLGIVIFVLAVALACGGVFLWARTQVSGEARVMPSVMLGSTDLTGMTRSQVLSALERAGYGGPAGMRLTLRYPGGEQEVTLEELGLAPDPEEAADRAMAWERSGDLNRDALTWLRSRVRPRVLELELPEPDPAEEPLRAMADSVADTLEREPGKTVVFADDKAVEITLGASGAHADREALLELLKEGLSRVLAAQREYDPAYPRGWGDVTVHYAPAEVPAEVPDLEELYASVASEPVNAVFDESYQVQAEKAGRGFDLEAAKRLLAAAEPGETVRIPLVYTEPEMTAEALEALLFRDLLASVDTPLTADGVRTENIRLAAERVNDTILLPGQIFSYNAALGERTEEKGYGPANAYLNGELVQEVGGGICQLSSALYWCVLLADEEVLERTNHAYYQTYLPYGFDATVSWGGPDFSFRLRGDYPIRIYARIEDQQLHVELWGTKLSEGHIELEYEVNQVVPHGTLYLENKNVRSGSQVILDYGRDGMTVTTYRAYYDGAGELLERVEEAVNEYASRDAEIIVAVGEKP